MARKKSATPVRRTPSDTHKEANGVVHQLDDAVHAIEKKIEEQAEAHARHPQEQKEAGLFQLLICVGGIYASLYVISFVLAHEMRKGKLCRSRNLVCLIG